MSSRRVRLTTGAEVDLDGDLVFLVDALYREIAVKKAMQHSVQDLHDEIRSVISQMSPGELEEYFANSLFLNYVTYENEMVERLMAKIVDRGDRKPARRK